MCVCVCLGRLPNHGEVLGCGGGRGEGRVDAGKHGWVCVEQWNDGQSSRVCSSIILKKGLAAQLCNVCVISSCAVLRVLAWMELQPGIMSSCRMVSYMCRDYMTLHPELLKILNV